jgi:autotransporter translocation and assembly factor TamB
MHISLLSMRIEIRNLALADSSGTRMAGIDQLVIDLSPAALLRRVLIVEEVLIDHPWAQLELDTNGRFSLLNALTTDSSPPDSVIQSPKPAKTSKPFTIKLKDLDIVRGTIRFATTKDSLSLHAQGLSINAKGETGTLSGEVGIKIDTLTLDKNKLQTSLRKFAFNTHMQNMNIDTVMLYFITNNSSFSLRGKASDLTKDPKIAFTLKSSFSLSELSPFVGFNNNSFSGLAVLDIGISGNVSNPDAVIDLSYSGGTIMGRSVDLLHMKNVLHNKIIELDPLLVRTPEGSITVSGTIDAKAVFPNGFLSAPASFQKFLYRFDVAASDLQLKTINPSISGIATLSAALSGNGIQPDSLFTKVELSAAIDSLQLDTSSSPLPVNVSLSSTVACGEAMVSSLTAMAGTSVIDLSGMYGISSGKIGASIQVIIPQLDELACFIGADSLAGSASLSLIAQGTVRHPQVTVNIHADTLQAGSTRIGNLVLDALLSDNGMAYIHNLSVQNRSSHLDLKGSTRVLCDGKPLPVDQMNFACSLSSQHLAIEDFIDSIRGNVSINADLNGTVNNPEGSVRLLVNDLYAAGQPVKEIRLDAQIEERQINLQPFLITLQEEQQLTATGAISLSDSFNIELQGRNVHLNSITALSSMDSLDGIVSLDATAYGTFTNPSAKAKIAVKDIRKGALSLEDVLLDIDLRDHNASVDGHVIGDITATYNLKTADFSTNLTINNLSLKPYLSLTGQNLDGTLSTSLQISGNVTVPKETMGQFSISKLFLTYDSIPIITTDNIHISLDKGSYSVPDFNMVLAGEGSISGRGYGKIDGSHDIIIDAMIPLTVLRHFVPDIPDIAGALAIDATFNGSAQAPILNASILLKDIGMSLPGLNGRLHGLNGQILANNQSVRIKSLKGNIDDGVFNVNASLKLDDFKPSDITADIDFKALPFGVPDMLDCVFDGKLKLSGNPDTSQFTGMLTLLEGVYFQDVVINPLSGFGKRKRKIAAPPKEQNTPYLKNLGLDIGIRSYSPFQVDNNLAQLSIVPDLQLTGTIATPVMNGRAKVEEGTITYQKKIFTVQRGVIDFINPYAIEPEVEISGVVPVRNVEIKIDISGPPDDLMFKLSSDSTDLQEKDLLSLLVVGKTPSELLGETTTGNAEQSNQQMLASLVASTFGEDVKKATGLDMLKVETGDTDNDNSDRIAVTLGKQLTKRLGTSYTLISENGKFFPRTTAHYKLLQNLGIAVYQDYQDTKGTFGGELQFSWEKR